jgi:hypothetical protein
MSNLTFFQNIDPTTYYSINVDFNNIEKYFNYLDKKIAGISIQLKIILINYMSLKKIALEKNSIRKK